MAYLVRHRKRNLADRMKVVRSRPEAERVYDEFAGQGEPGDTVWIHLQPRDPSDGMGMVLRWKTVAPEITVIAERPW